MKRQTEEGLHVLYLTKYQLCHHLPFSYYLHIPKVSLLPLENDTHTHQHIGFWPAWPKDCPGSPAIAAGLSQEYFLWRLITLWNKDSEVKCIRVLSAYSRQHHQLDPTQFLSNHHLETQGNLELWQNSPGKCGF